MPARVDQYDAMGLLPSGKRGARSFEGPPNRFRELNRLERKRLRDEVDVVALPEKGVFTPSFEWHMGAPCGTSRHSAI
jgi:hypothetical protein